MFGMFGKHSDNMLTMSVLVKYLPGDVINNGPKLGPRKTKYCLIKDTGHRSSPVAPTLIEQPDRKGSVFDDLITIVKMRNPFEKVMSE